MYDIRKRNLEENWREIDPQSPPTQLRMMWVTHHVIYQSAVLSTKTDVQHHQTFYCKPATVWKHMKNVKRLPFHNMKVACHQPLTC